MKKALVVGGANGIGLAIAHLLAERSDVETVDIIDLKPVKDEYNNSKFNSHIFDLQNCDFLFFDRFTDIDILMITAGFGRLSLFKDLDENHIILSFNVNAIAPIRIIHRFIDRLQSETDFYCGVMVSIAGFMSSPFFSVYAATKAALKIFIESVNIELEKGNSSNRILNVSPGAIKGTSFNKGKTDLEITRPLAQEIVDHLFSKDDLFIPQYEKTFKDVLKRYSDDFRAEGRHSYEYKKAAGRIKN